MTSSQSQDPNTDSVAEALGLQPLTARSVILSVLLGTHPPRLPVKILVRTAELFGITEGTTRVALSRLAADGDVVAEDRGYRLTARLLNRQKRQDEGHHPVTRPWKGGWEVAVASPSVRSAAERMTLGAELASLRLAELRPGVWARPDNLIRPWPDELAGRVIRFDAPSGFDQTNIEELLPSLWDLDAWAERADRLIAALDSVDDMAQRFMVATAMVRHFRDDPVLPPDLLPGDWPGEVLRKAYSSYETELSELLRRERDRHG
ncbi:MAG TPA: PaaX family transcriptional regulator C-terminal domain-containing protein [Acidimicrobiales bacterium]|nr:PaaX family transcriptional regulator C-terminal domain-containing protein [Acidimicrobiales bacterium]